MVLLINLLEGTGLAQPSVCSLSAKTWGKALAHKRVDIVSAVPVARLSLTKHWGDISFPTKIWWFLSLKLQAWMLLGRNRLTDKRFFLWNFSAGPVLDLLDRGTAHALGLVFFFRATNVAFKLMSFQVLPHNILIRHLLLW